MTLLGQAAMSVMDGCIDVFGKRVRRGELVRRIISPPCSSLLGLANPSEDETARVCLFSVRDGLETMRFGNGTSVLGLVGEEPCVVGPCAHPFVIVRGRPRDIQDQSGGEPRSSAHPCRVAADCCEARRGV